MNWQKWGAILSVVIPLVAGTWWFGENVVLAADFKQYQTDQRIRWIMYDEHRLFREWQDLSRIDNKSPFVNDRIIVLEREMEKAQKELEILRAR